MKLTNEHIKLLKVYCKLVAKNGMHPSRSDMMKAGYNRDQLRHYFTSLQNLKDEARKYEPEAFKGIIDETLFTPKRHKELEKSLKGHKRFFITTAVTGCQVHEGFLESVNTFCSKMDAKLLILPATDPAASVGWALDSKLGEDNIVFSDLQLNSNVFLSAIKLSAKQIDPITGLERIGQSNGSFIYASPKQRLKYVCVANTKYPHAEMTTGAITLPNYGTDRYMSERTGYIANHDHVMGGIIVEIVDNKRFHFRQVQADKNGHFIDLGVFYKGKKTSRIDAAAFIMGDWHSGETDPTAKQAWKEVCALVKPDYIMVHDGFNGLSVNHHDKHKKITLARRAGKGLLNLEAELTVFAKDLNELQTWVKKDVVIVKSNHDIFLDRWLEDGEYKYDPYNYHLGLKLAEGMCREENPLKLGVEMFGLKNPDRINWLGMRDDFQLAGVQLAAHGHKGPNGSKGNIKGMEKGYRNSVSGHSHTPEILRGAWQVGTTSYLELDYNEGLSSWMHCSCILYPNGSRQLINSFEGSWRL